MVAAFEALITLGCRGRRVYVALDNQAVFQNLEKGRDLTKAVSTFPCADSLRRLRDDPGIDFTPLKVSAGARLLPNVLADSLALFGSALASSGDFAIVNGSRPPSDIACG